MPFNPVYTGPEWVQKSLCSRGSGILLRDRTGDRRTQRNANEPPSIAIPTAVRNPRNSPSNPPVIAPRGIVPQTKKRIVAFIRPCKRSGTIACLKLTWLTLYTTVAMKLTNWPAMMDSMLQLTPKPPSINRGSVNRGDTVRDPER